MTKVYAIPKNNLLVDERSISINSCCRNVEQNENSQNFIELKKEERKKRISLATESESLPSVEITRSDVHREQDLLDDGLDLEKNPA